MLSLGANNNLQIKVNRVTNFYEKLNFPTNVFYYDNVDDRSFKILAFAEIKNINQNNNYNKNDLVGLPLYKRIVPYTTKGSVDVTGIIS